MSGKIKKMNLWVRRRSHLTLIVVGTVVVLLLFFNEETSLKLNMEYQEQINDLKREIKECEDSAAWYRARREALYIDPEDLEYLVREQYHMQRPSEDVYVIK